MVREEEIEPVVTLIVENITGFNTAEIFSGKPFMLSEKTVSSIGNILSQLKNNRPIQYILGETWFYGRKFSVNEHVLIPRQETEELVHRVIVNYHGAKSILDIGTGSGCIAISLKKELETPAISALDISSEALQVARSNAAKIGTDISFQKLDILKEIPSGKYDILVSNPPYVTLEEKKFMERNVLDYEPHSALFVNDPLLFYRRIIDVSKHILKDSGLIYFEINEAYGEEIKALFTEKLFRDVKLVRDLNGKNRIVYGRK